MTTIQSALCKGALIAAVATGALAATSSAALADIVCNRFGECWHVREHYRQYPPTLGIMFHDDAWAERHRGHHWHWRTDRDDDHGYYERGEWHPF